MHTTYCTHLKFLEKKKLNQLVYHKFTAQEASSENILCLHCDTLIEAQKQNSIKQHNESNQNHTFYLSLHQFSIWCQSCKDTIQNLIFEGNEKDEGSMRMIRFSDYLHDIWHKITPSKQTTKLVRGIKNIGNTCFFNVVLQCLQATEALTKLYNEIITYPNDLNRLSIQRKIIPKQVQFFYDDILQKRQSSIWTVVEKKKTKKQKTQNLKSISNIRNCLLNNHFSAFLKEIRSESSIAFEPIVLFKNLGQLQAKYLEKEEQDAEELLLFLIDSLSQGERIGLCKDQERYKQIEGLLGPQKISPIQQIFGFYLYNQTICAQCKKLTSVFDLGYNLSISLEDSKIKQNESWPVPNQQTIQVPFYEELHYPKNKKHPQILEYFFQTQCLTRQRNYYQCENCESLKGYRRYFLADLPEIFIISIKRFNHKMDKRIQYLQFEQIIDLSGLVISSSEQEYKYRLYGLIVHEGKSIKSGHYVCFIRVQQNWIKCSDTLVRLVKWSEVKAQQAYILLYQRYKSE